LEQPNKVYRYQKFSELSINALCHDQLYFSDPKAFNDPLDCQPHVESDSHINELRLVLEKQIELRVEAETISSLTSAKVTGESAILHAKATAKQIAQNELTRIAYYTTDPDYKDDPVEVECRLLTYGIQNELLKQYDRGICCFASSGDNPLLWSHYGDQHRGLCAGYSLNRKPKPNMHRVLYGSNRIIHTSAIVKAILQKNVEYQKILDQDVLLRKALPWKYEEEWRLLGKRGIQSSVLELKDITFGLRCPAAVRHMVIAAFKDRDRGIDFYEIYQIRGSFDLKKRIIDAEDLRGFPRIAMSGIEMFGPIPTGE